MSRVEKFFRIAKKVAEEGRTQEKKSLHGAVLAQGSRIISSSCNKVSYCSFGERFLTREGIATVHAEMGTVLGQSKDQTMGGHVYVVRIDRENGNLLYSRPCQMCQDMLRFVGVTKIIYSISETEYGKIKL